MRSVIWYFLVFLSAFPQLAMSEDLKTQQVVVSGIGDSPQSAAQNAAENALTQVVGSFVDTETILKKNTQIQNGVKQQAKEIDTKTREYSQGSIKKFEIISFEQQGSLYKVTASIEVRIEDFKAYIKKVAEGEAAIQEGLFAKMTVGQKNAESAKELIFMKYLPQVLAGEVQELQIGTPIPLKESGMRAYLEYYQPTCEDGVVFGLSNACSDSTAFSSWKSKASQIAQQVEPNCGSFDQNRTVVLPMEIKLNANFQDNLMSTLSGISDKKSTFPGDSLAYAQECMRLTQDFCVAVAKSEHSTGVEIYSINDILYNEGGVLLSDAFENIRDGKVALDLSILGPSGESLAEIQLASNGVGQYLSNCTFGQSQNADLKGVLIGNPNLVAKDNASVVFFNSSSTRIVLELNPEILQKAQSVSVRYHQ